MNSTSLINSVDVVKGFLLKVGLLFLTLTLNNDAALRLLGWINETFLNGYFRTATLFYLADSRYVESVTFRWYARRMKWTPLLAGYFSYSGAAGFILAIGCSEDEIRDPKNEYRILEIHRRVERIASLLSANSASYAGILPSLLVRLGVKREPIEAIRTVQWVGKALQTVRDQCGLPSLTRVVVLGSDGHIGRRLVQLLKETESSVILELDSRALSLEQARNSLVQLTNPFILINVAKQEALDEYIDQIPVGSVVLNEVYPECEEQTLTALKSKNIRYFHICGVLAESAFPRFPRAYSGAIPCCAASAVASHNSDKHNHETVVLREP